MPTEGLFQEFLRDLDQYMKREFAKRLAAHGIGAGVINARYVTGNFNSGGVSIAAIASRNVTAAEAIGAGNLVGYNAEGKAILASTSLGIAAKGFALVAITAGATGAIYSLGIVSGLTGRTIGATQYLSASGAVTETPPITSGYLMQQVGVAVSATEFAFQPQMGILLA